MVFDSTEINLWGVGRDLPSGIGVGPFVGFLSINARGWGIGSTGARFNDEML